MPWSRKVYLSSVPYAQALARLQAALDDWGPVAETIPTEDALGRVTIHPVYAVGSSPHYHAAAMDGIAVRAATTFAASETEPVYLDLNQQCWWVDTGDPLPPEADAVIMVEDLNRDGDRVEIRQAAAPWQHVRPMGEDVVATEMLLPQAHTIRPADLGALLAAGVVQVAVAKRPVVAFLPTGTELVQPTAAARPGEIIEFNSRVVLGQVAQWGGLPRRHPILPDQYETIKAAVAEAVQTADIVVLGAGSSAGSEDFSVQILSELGTVLAHGIAIKPGKPAMVAVVGGKPVLGLPGYPVSTYLTADLLLRPLVYRYQGLQPPARPTAEAVLARRLTSPMGVDEFVRVKLGRVGEQLVATPISRGAGVITSLVRADGILTIPAQAEGVGEGQPVRVELMRPLAEILETVQCTGSHDITLDLLGSYLRRHHGPLSLASAHVGSQGGLTALKRGEAHLAGTHLLDEETGEYNVAYVQRYLGRPARLVLLARREQGFLVQPGNPVGIASVADLVRPGVTFVNRQRGAGTRILLDYELRRAGVEPAQVQGYRREEFTHMAVAAAVASGAATCGLGIRAAAKALNLDFVPLTFEEYELLIPDEHWEHPGVQAILAILQRPDFQADVAALGGYDLLATGRIRRVE